LCPLRSETTLDLQYDPYLKKIEPDTERGPYTDRYPVALPNGHSLVIPIVPLPRQEGQEEQAISLLMSTELTFEVADVLGKLLAEKVAAFKPDVIVGIPTLGLSWAEKVARLLGHDHYVPLSTTKKFWFQDSAAETSSITSGGGKKLYLAPEVEYRIKRDKRVVIVDDVVCTAGSLMPAIKLITEAGGKIVGIGVMLTEGTQWQHVLQANGLSPHLVVSVGRIPLFRKVASGSWEAM